MKARADEQDASARIDCLPNRLAVSKRAQGEHVFGMRNTRQPSRRAAQTEDQDVELDLAAAFERKGSVWHRATHHPLIQLELDAFLRVVGLIVKEDLGQLDLTTKELLGQIWTVVGPVVVRTDDHDLAVESFLAQREGGRVAGPASTNNDDSFHSH